MKKAKILVPAIAALVLSSAAAVTGTVAWFTSSSTVNVNATTGLSVVNSSTGKLEYKFTADTNGSTAISGGSSSYETPNSITHKTLVDGSVALTADAAKVFEPDNPGATNFVDTTANYAEGSNFRATMFTIDFKYTFYKGTTQKSLDLYLDGTSAQIQNSAGKKYVTGEPNPESEVKVEEKSVLPGLRIGFLNKEQKIFTVYAPFKTKSTVEISGLSYIGTAGDVSANSSYAYKDTHIVDETKNIAAKDVSNKVATFTITDEVNEANSFAVEKHVEVWTWFEGTDDAVVNDAKLVNDIKQLFTFGVALA